MWALLKTAIATIRASIEMRDAFLALGLALLAVGLWHVFPPAAAIVPGAVLVGVAIFGVKGPAE